jgi:uncharacterized protein YacL
MLFSQIILSGSGSALSTSAHLIISHLLDFVIDDTVSDIIGLIVGFFINFYLQSNAFLKKVKYDKTLYKFILSEFIVIYIFHISYKYLRENDTIINKYINEYINKKWKNTTIRIIVGIIQFFIISFPMRKFLVFKVL